MAVEPRFIWTASTKVLHLLVLVYAPLVLGVGVVSFLAWAPLDTHTSWAGFLLIVGCLILAMGIYPMVAVVIPYTKLRKFTVAIDETYFVVESEGIEVFKVPKRDVSLVQLAPGPSGYDLLFPWSIAEGVFPRLRLFSANGWTSPVRIAGTQAELREFENTVKRVLGLV